MFHWLDHWSSSIGAIAASLAALASIFAALFSCLNWRRGGMGIPPNVSVDFHPVEHWPRWFTCSLTFTNMTMVRWEVRAISISSRPGGALASRSPPLGSAEPSSDRRADVIQIPAVYGETGHPGAKSATKIGVYLPEPDRSFRIKIKVTMLSLETSQRRSVITIKRTAIASIA